jgi:ATP-binding cassette, subfamily F, member 3
MFSVQNLSMSFSGNEIFRNVGFLINEKDRIGLVGKNGAGKSTLLRIIHGDMQPDTGNIVIPTDKSMGYLPQEMEIIDNKTVISETISAFDELLNLQKELDELNEYFASSHDYESEIYTRKLDRLHWLNERLTMMNSGSMEGEAEKVLMGLGFMRSDFQKPTSSLSGGWRMRIELAKILLKRPDLLLLDEPTNHLDIESIQWLEEMLSTWPGAIVLISHDRSFLDKVTNRTIEISLGRIRDYKYSYSKYVEIRELELKQNESEFNNQQKQIKEIENFIERFRYKSTKAKQVQSRIKLLDKMDKVELETVDASAMHFRFPPAPPSGKVSLEIKNYGKTYGDKVVLKDVNFIIKKNDFVAFVGKNGEGKSTLVKSIVGLIDYQGEINTGYNVQIGYYAQNQTDMLDVNKTVLEVIDEAAVGDIRKNIRGILGSFLFGEDDIDKKVKVLSGGEKARLSLAKMLLTPVNLLVLDEPTNHLDMLSRDILKNALLQYTGTLILVSHDRDFLRGLSDITYEFKDQKLVEHLGGIDLFLEKRALENLKLLETSKREAASQKDEKTGTGKLDYLEKKERDKFERKLKKEIENFEVLIANIEKELEISKKKLDYPEKHGIDLSDPKFYNEFTLLEKKLKEAMEAWEKAHLSYDVEFGEV